VDDVDDFTPGMQARLLFTNQRFRLLSATELFDDDLLYQASKNSNLFAVQTNSATFGKSAESAQQSITRIRAIEHGRNIASCFYNWILSDYRLFRER
jgi:apolipoprotein N-acyltransferase